MKIRIHPAFAAYLASMALLTGVSGTLCALASLTVHELAHLAAARAVGDRLGSLELTPFGGVMTYEPGQSPSKGLRGMLVAAAGPLANECAIFLLSVLCTRTAPNGALAETLRGLLTANAAMLMINLMPALPLDGGRMLFCAGYYVLSVPLLSLILCVVGVALGLLLCALAVYGALKWGMLNLSLLIVGAYLPMSAIRSRDALLTENLYAVVHERAVVAGRTVPVKLYRVSADTPLYALVAPMAKSRACAFLIEAKGKDVLLSERAVRTWLLEAPSMHIGEAFFAANNAGRGEKN